MGHKGLLVSKAVVTCSPDHQVPVKILNPTADTVHINKGAYLATFKLCDNYTDIFSVKSDIKQCMHVKLQSESQSGQSFEREEQSSKSFSCGAKPDINQERFQTYFAENVSPDLDAEQRQQVLDCLFEHRNVFVTPENPNLGLTHEVEHIIQLKPDAQSKHQRPYRLSPDKKQVLRHHLDE